MARLNLRSAAPVLDPTPKLSFLNQVNAAQSSGAPGGPSALSMNLTTDIENLAVP